MIMIMIMIMMGGLMERFISYIFFYLIHLFFFFKKRSKIVDNKYLALPNDLEIHKTLLFHVTKTLTPKALWS